MVGSRTATALVGLAASLLASTLAWWYLDTLLVFLLVPFVPVLFWRASDHERPPVRTCPRCGYRTRDPEYTHCPRDGTRLDGT